MAAFSVFLFVKCLCVVLFAVCGATDILLLLGSRAGIVPYSCTGVHAAFRLNPSARPKKRFYNFDRIHQYRCASHDSAFDSLF